MVLLAACIQTVKRHLLLEKLQSRLSKTFCGLKKLPIINPDVVHPHLLLELDFVQHLVAGGCLGRSLPNFNNIFFEEQHASGCRLLTPALGISSWEMSLPCRAHFGALYLSDLGDLQLGPWGCKQQQYKCIF